MRLRKILTRRIDHDEPGLNVQADVQAVVSINVEQPGEPRGAVEAQPEEKEAQDE